MSPKQIPKHLGKKLRSIREWKGWSLDEMAEAVGKKDPSRRTRVYEWEQGIRQPDLKTLLAYAKIIGTSTDILIDDDLNIDLNQE
jgi:transcriptional regulator with XRE-family HTH domain